MNDRVAAVIVTRGDVDLAPILDPLPRQWERIVWDNGKRELRRHLPGSFTADFHGNDHTGPLQDLAVYGRYAALEHALDSDVIYVQDDDVVLHPESFDALLAAYEPGVLIANMPERFREHYPDSCLVGFGAIFDRDLPTLALGRFANAYGTDDVLNAIEQDPGFYHRACDVVFTTLTPRKLIDVPYTDRPFASDAVRMWKQPGHFAERQWMLVLARRVRDSAKVTA